MSITLNDVTPKESPIQRYLLVNTQGETIYAYCKVLYEQISEENIFEDYEIKNVPLGKKGRLRKDSIHSDYNLDKEEDKRKIIKEFKAKKEAVSFTSAFNHKVIKEKIERKMSGIMGGRISGKFS